MRELFAIWLRGLLTAVASIAIVGVVAGIVYVSGAHPKLMGYVGVGFGCIVIPLLFGIVFGDY